MSRLFRITKVMTANFLQLVLVLDFALKTVLNSVNFATITIADGYAQITSLINVLVYIHRLMSAMAASTRIIVSLTNSIITQKKLTKNTWISFLFREAVLIYPPEELQHLNELLSPLIRKGQPLSHVYAAHKDDIPVCRRTVYNYLDQGLFDVRNIDLPRRVRYKLRKKQRSDNPINYDYRSKRTYKDFEKYIAAFPDYEVVELDTVKGGREAGKCLMTLLFRKSSFMLCFLLPTCTQKAVCDVFDHLYETLGRRLFMKTFRIILTDNGPEFKDPWSIEKDSHGKQRTKVFYCDPYTSSQKGQLEKNHEFIRYVIPKGKSMQSYTQNDIALLARHINSVARDSLNERCPFDLAELLLDKKVLAFAGRNKVSPDDVLLKPALFKK